MAIGIIKRGKSSISFRLILKMLSDLPVGDVVRAYSIQSDGVWASLCY